MSNKFPLEVRQHYTIKKAVGGFILSCDDCKNEGNTFVSSFSKTFEPLQNATSIDDLIHHSSRVHPYIIEEAGEIASEEAIVNDTTTDAIVPPQPSSVSLEEILTEGLNSPETEMKSGDFDTIREEARNRFSSSAPPRTHEETVDYINNLDLPPPPTSVSASNAMPTIPMADTNLFTPTVPSPQMEPTWKAEKLSHSILIFPVMHKSSFVYDTVNQEANGKLNIILRAPTKKTAMVIAMRAFEAFKK